VHTIPADPLRRSCQTSDNAARANGQPKCTCGVCDIKVVGCHRTVSKLSVDGLASLHRMSWIMIIDCHHPDAPSLCRLTERAQKWRWTYLCSALALIGVLLGSAMGAFAIGRAMVDSLADGIMRLPD
jgi:hypothetical protein